MTSHRHFSAMCSTDRSACPADLNAGSTSTPMKPSRPGQRVWCRCAPALSCCPRALLRSCFPRPSSSKASNASGHDTSLFTASSAAPAAAAFYQAPLHQLPLFVPAGAMLPLTAESDAFSLRHDEPSRCLRRELPNGIVCTFGSVVSEGTQAAACAPDC